MQQSTGAVTSSMTKVTGRPAIGAAGSMCIRTLMPLADLDQVLAEGIGVNVGMGSGGKPGGVGNIAGAVVLVRRGTVVVAAGAAAGAGAPAGVVGAATVTVVAGAAVDVTGTVGATAC